LLAGSQILADSQIDVDTVISALTELTKDGLPRKRQGRVGGRSCRVDRSGPERPIVVTSYA